MKEISIEVNGGIEIYGDTIKQRFKEIEVIVSKTHTQYSKLNDYVKGQLDESRKTIQSSILIPLIVNEMNEVEVLLTLRHVSISVYKGEVVLPGGRFEESDGNVINTALREAQEEIGLMINNVDILMTFVPILLPRKEENHLVYPVFGLVRSSFIAKLNPSEVCDIFTVPLRHFLSIPTFDEISGLPGLTVNRSTTGTICVKGFTYGFLVVCAGLFYATSPPECLFTRYPILYKVWEPIDDAYRDCSSKL